MQKRKIAWKEVPHSVDSYVTIFIIIHPTVFISAEANISRKSAMKILNNFTGYFSDAPIFDFA